jgi:Skp family chaperone for outer membrane proteins
MDRGCRQSRSTRLRDGRERFQGEPNVKRTVIVAAGVVALGVAVYVGQLWAQNRAPAAPAAEAKTKVALFNLSYVIKNYAKYTAFQEEMKTAVAPFQAKDNSLKAEGQKLAQEAQLPTTKPERREEIEKRLGELKHLIEVNKTDANKALGKKQEEQLRILYMDVRTVSEKIASSRGFEVVLHFNDALGDEYWSGPNIARKMQAGALIPMYWTNSLDISTDIVTTLNSSYKGARPATTPTR